MLSPHRSAQLGLGLVCLIVIWSLGVIGAGASGPGRSVGRTGIAVPPPVMATVPAAPAVRFALADLEGRTVTESAIEGRVSVLYFTSVRCAISNRYASRFADLARRYADDSRVQVLAIETSSASDGVSATEVRVQNHLSDSSCPALMDRGATLAKAMGVTHTPTLVVLDASGAVVYRGAIDNNAGDRRRVTRAWARDAIEHVLAGEPISVSSTPTGGCAIP